MSRLSNWEIWGLRPHSPAEWVAGDMLQATHHDPCPACDDPSRRADRCPDHQWLRANANGYGDGDGYGYGYGDGDGYSYGDGYSKGDGDGDGYGYGNGYGDGDGYSKGDGYE